jgi:hypothetical protein
MVTAARRKLRLGAVVLVALAAVGLSACGGGGHVAASLPTSIRLASADAAADNAVTVSPLPGTPDASPTTQISFLGGPRTLVSDVTVTGSLSGTHAGTLEAYSTGTGESFLPQSPFTAGEHVHVTARVTQDGGAATAVSTSFTVAFQAPVSQRQFPISPGNNADIQHYRSAPTLTPTTVRITTPARPGATPGDLFLAPYQAKGTPGPMIVDQSGNLVWFHPLPADDAASNFRVQTYEGQPVLTWWQGRILSLGFGQGEDEIYNTSYQPVATVHAGNGYHADLHEFRLEADGTAWIDAFDPVKVNLASIGGYAHAVVNDSIVEHIDIKTGLVMWEWHALGHIPLQNSYSQMPRSTPTNWDYVHVNSIDPGPNDNVLLSARNTSQLYDVDIHTGAFIWQLGGKHSDFTEGPGARTYWQHDAEWEPHGLISVFDNGSDPPEERQSRGLLLRLDTTTHTATLVKAFTDPEKTLLASSQGDLISLTGGNWLMGYGPLPDFVEYSPSGSVLFGGELGRNVQDFRTYFASWTGQPKTLPAIATQRDTNDAVTVEASWNGATNIASWKVLAGSAASTLTTVATTAKHGFETTITIHTAAPMIAVAALGASGSTLATSAAIKPTGG